jgi:hypothetical protein
MKKLILILLLPISSYGAPKQQAAARAKVPRTAKPNIQQKIPQIKAKAPSTPKATPIVINKPTIATAVKQPSQPATVNTPKIVAPQKRVKQAAVINAPKAANPTTQVTISAPQVTPKPTISSPNVPQTPSMPTVNIAPTMPQSPIQRNMPMVNIAGTANLIEKPTPPIVPPAYQPEKPGKSKRNRRRRPKVPVYYPVPYVPYIAEPVQTGATQVIVETPAQSIETATEAPLLPQEPAIVSVIPDQVPLPSATIIPPIAMPTQQAVNMQLTEQSGDILDLYDMTADVAQSINPQDLQQISNQ